MCAARDWPTQPRVASITAVKAERPQELAFGDRSMTESALSEMAQGLRLSGILKISNEIAAMRATGRQVYNLALGDFDSRYFPIPPLLVEATQRALASGVTNYPAPMGIMALREAVSAYVKRSADVTYPVDSVLITSGGRPGLYGAYRTVLSPGDTVVYSVPSWQNDSYAWLAQARAVEVTAKSENGFQPTVEELRPHLASARLLCLCSPGNPTGTAMDPEQFKRILEAVVEENARRMKSAEPNKLLFVLYDQIYGELRVHGNKHRYAAALVPESAPYVISMDGISKAFAATGLRVAWVLAPPAIITRMGDFLSHVGTWAPHAEQAGTAELLNDPDAIARYRTEMDESLHARLDAMYRGFVSMREEGMPVDVLYPDGAIYVSLQLRLAGASIGGRRISTNEEIRSLLLERAGVAAVPFQAFGLKDESGWFRLSVGALSMEEIPEIHAAVRSFLNEAG